MLSRESHFDMMAVALPTSYVLHLTSYFLLLTSYFSLLRANIQNHEKTLCFVYFCRTDIINAAVLRERLNPKVMGECIPFGNDPRKCFRPSSHDCSSTSETIKP